MEILHMIFIAPFLDMVALPDLFFQGLWDGFVGGTLYALLALGFVLLCTVGTIIGGYIHGHMSISAVIKNLK